MSCSERRNRMDMNAAKATAKTSAATAPAMSARLLSPACSSTRDKGAATRMTLMDVPGMLTLLAAYTKDVPRLELCRTLEPSPLLNALATSS